MNLFNATLVSHSPSLNVAPDGSLIAGAPTSLGVRCTLGSPSDDMKKVLGATLTGKTASLYLLDNAVPDRTFVPGDRLEVLGDKATAVTYEIKVALHHVLNSSLDNWELAIESK